MIEIKNGCEYYGISNLGIEINGGIVNIYADEKLIIGGIDLAVLEVALQKEKENYIKKCYEIKTDLE